MVRNRGANYLTIANVTALLSPAKQATSDFNSNKETAHAGQPVQDRRSLNITSKETIERIVAKEQPKSRKWELGLLRLGTSLSTALLAVLDAGATSVAIGALVGTQAQATAEAAIPDRSIEDLINVCRTIFEPNLTIGPQSSAARVVFLPLESLLGNSGRRLYKKETATELLELQKRLQLKVTLQPVAPKNSESAISKPER
jgi:hypothetical protein